jgi:hypothetical protein
LQQHHVQRQPHLDQPLQHLQLHSEQQQYAQLPLPVAVSHDMFGDAGAALRPASFCSSSAHGFALSAPLSPPPHRALHQQLASSSLLQSPPAAGYRVDGLSSRANAAAAAAESSVVQGGITTWGSSAAAQAPAAESFPRIEYSRANEHNMPHFGSTLADPVSSASSGQQRQKQQQQQQQHHRESDAAFPIEELRVLAARLQVRKYVYLLHVGSICRWYCPY